VNGTEESASGLPTLMRMWSGHGCPHETQCSCRTKNFCPRSRGKRFAGKHDYPMLHIAGCSLGHNHCCCRILDEIESLAAGYLRQAAVVEPPVPVEVVRLFDPDRTTELRALPLKAYLGCVWFLEDEWVIHLNSNEPPTTNRFTAFHEGFHILCRNSGLAFRQAGEYYRPLNERLADYFAASILMPRSLVHQAWPAVRSPARMAKIFEVPEPVMRKWLSRLRLWKGSFQPGTGSSTL